MEAGHESDELDYDDDNDVYEIESAGKKYRRLNSKSNNKSSSSSSNMPIFESLSSEERLKNYMKFYLHYGACSLVWFINLPVIIFVTSFVSELYRPRLVLSNTTPHNHPLTLPNLNLLFC